MAARRYQNFDLALEGVGPGLYRARVVQCPVGEYPSVAFSLPFGESELELLMLKLDPGRSGTRRSGFDSQRQACLDLGGGLSFLTADFLAASAMILRAILDTIGLEPSS